MRIIKEFCKTNRNYRCIVRTNTYAKTLQHIVNLYDVALADYPNIGMGDVDIIKYGGERYKRTIGIEFNASEVFDGWDEVNTVEYEL